MPKIETEIGMEPGYEEKFWSRALWVGAVLGGVLRFMPGLIAGFPVNDGGMFLTMILDLQRNRFIIPQITSYNFSQIPYAYPPLGFYLAGFLSSLLSVSPIVLLVWLPPLVSSAIIPAFYWLTIKVTNSRPIATIAALFYALTPGIADWLIMGGGLTRSLGILFFVLGLGYLYDLFRNGGRRSLALSVLSCSLVVLSHPEVGLQMAGFCALFWLLYGRNHSGIRNAVILLTGVAVITSIWWGKVLHLHGFEPFLSALQTGVREKLTASMFHTFFSYQGVLPLLPILYLVGLFVIVRGRSFLPVLGAFLPFMLDPRNAPAVAIFALLIMASEGLVFLKVKFVQALEVSLPARAAIFRERVPVFVFAILLIYLLAVSAHAATRLSTLNLASPDWEAMEWVRDNTPTESKFLLLTNTGQVSPMADAHLEWFPALANRQSLNTIQGLEWILGDEFYLYSLRLAALQACEDTLCLYRWLDDAGLHADYIMFFKRRSSPELLTVIRDDQDFEVAYESPSAVVLEVLP